MLLEMRDSGEYLSFSLLRLGVFARELNVNLNIVERLKINS